MVSGRHFSLSAPPLPQDAPPHARAHDLAFGLGVCFGVGALFGVRAQVGVDDKLLIGVV